MKAANTTNFTAVKNIFLLAGFLLAAMAMAGCSQNPTNENAPASTNSASEQPMPGAAVSNNAAMPPAVANPGNTNNSSATNQ